LISENWHKEPAKGFAIPAKVLRERLPATVLTAIYRDHIVYGEALAHPGELSVEDGNLAAAMMGALAEAVRDKHGDLPTPTEEQVRQVKRLIEKRDLPNFALAFVDFVELAERKEKETG